MNMDKQVFDSIKKTLAVTLPKRAIVLLYGRRLVVMHVGILTGIS